MICQNINTAIRSVCVAAVFAVLLCSVDAIAAEVKKVKTGAEITINKGGVAVFALGDGYVVVSDDAAMKVGDGAVKINADSGSAAIIKGLDAATLVKNGNKFTLGKTKSGKYSAQGVVLTKDGLVGGNKPHVINTADGVKFLVMTANEVAPWTLEKELNGRKMLKTLSGVAVLLEGGSTLAIPAPIIEETKEIDVVSTVSRSNRTISGADVKTEKERIEAYDRALDKLWSAIAAVEEITVPGEGSKVNLFGLDKADLPSDPALLAQGVERARDDFFPDIEADDGLTYYERMAAMRRALVAAPTVVDRDKVRFDTAKMLLAYSRPVEALGALALMERNADDLPEYAPARMFAAIALAQLGNFEKANEIFRESIDPERHRLLWHAFTLEGMGKNKKAIELFKDYMPASLDYPMALKIQLRLSEARALLATNSLPEVVVALDELRNVQGKDVDPPPEAKFILAKALMGQGDEKTALQLMSEAAESANINPAVAFQSQYDYVSLLYERRQVDRMQAIGYLEDLRSLWRGNDLEREILFKLAEMYREEGMHREALQRYQTYTVYYPGTELQDKVNQEMVRTFMDAFKPRNIMLQDSLGVLGMYYDFRELTPPGRSGDDLIAEIGKRLLQMGLNKRAIALLTGQLKHRVTDKIKRAELGLYIAGLNEDAAQWHEGLEVLDETEYDKMPYSLGVKRKIQRSRLLLGMERYSDAEKALEGVDGESAEQARIDVIWAKADDNELVDILMPKFAETDAQEVWDTRRKRNFLGLAYALNRLGRLGELEDLKERFAVQVFENKLGTEIDFLLLDIGASAENVSPPADDSLGRVVKALAEYNKFYDEYENSRDIRMNENYSRSQFGRRR